MSPSNDSVPSGNVSDNSYMSKASDPVPVVGDAQEVESSINPGQEDSDATLGKITYACFDLMMSALYPISFTQS